MTSIYDLLFPPRAPTRPGTTVSSFFGSNNAGAATGMGQQRVYGNREDGTPKGAGYFGELRRPDGDVSTELSIGVNLDGKEQQIPLLVPTLNRQEIDALLAGGKPSEGMVRRAVDHAILRLREGKSPFAGPGERGGIPR